MSRRVTNTDPWRQRVDSADWEAITAEVKSIGGALLPRHPDWHYHRWSRWRRRHQARARRYHYQQRQRLYLTLRL
jgi:hypothetical protein